MLALRALYGAYILRRLGTIFSLLGRMRKKSSCVRNAEAGRIDTSMRWFVLLPFALAVKIERAGAKLVCRSHPERRHALVHRSKRQCLTWSTDDLELRASRERNCDRHRIGASTGQVVRHADTDIGLVPGRERGRRIRREHEIAADCGCTLDRTDQVGRHRHRHDAQIAIEVIGHMVGEVLLAVHVDDA